MERRYKDDGDYQYEDFKNDAINQLGSQHTDHGRTVPDRATIDDAANDSSQMWGDPEKALKEFWTSFSSDYVNVWTALGISLAVVVLMYIALKYKWVKI